MSTIITAIILIACTIGIPSIFIFRHKKRRRKQTEARLRIFSQEGSRQGLSFSGQELLKDKLIGFDGLKRVLLVFQFGNTGSVRTINIGDVKNCSVNRIYHSVHMGDDKSKDIEQQLRAIDLKFDFKDGSESFLITFYDSLSDNIYEMSALYEKARNWEMVISKIILSAQKQRA